MRQGGDRLRHGIDDYDWRWQYWKLLAGDEKEGEDENHSGLITMKGKEEEVQK